MGKPKILIYHTGSLGDTLVAIPAIKEVRNYFKGAHITLLSDLQYGKKLVSPQEILEDTGLIDDFITYTVYRKNRQIFKKLEEYTTLLIRLRRHKFEELVYLIRSRRNVFEVFRDLLFFRLAGIRKFYGHKFNFVVINHKKLPKNVLHVSDQLLVRLAKSGIPVPEVGKADPSLPINEEDKITVENWNCKFPDNGDNPWVAVGFGTKMQVKRWPLARYEEVLSRLIGEFNIWPVFFGGLEDRIEGEKLIHNLGRGNNVAGILSVKQGIAAMKRCCLYLGNDTGIMHMAVAAGLRCVGIFSSRNFPGEWDPYGNGHIVLRKYVDCMGCRLEKCSKGEKACINLITTDEVYRAVAELLKSEIK